MSRRINSDLLLVGSLPADSTEESLQAGGELFGDLVFALPDGDTGNRKFWAAYEHSHMWSLQPEIETLRQPGRPPKHNHATTVLKIREGVSELHLDRWPRIDDAIESYPVFRRLRDEGVIPSGVRFQLALPFPTSGASGFKGD